MGTTPGNLKLSTVQSAANLEHVMALCGLMADVKFSILHGHVGNSEKRLTWQNRPGIQSSNWTPQRIDSQKGMS